MLSHDKPYKSQPVMLAMFLLTFGSLYYLIEMLHYIFVPANEFVLITLDIFSGAIIVRLTYKAEENKKTKTATVASALLPLIAIFYVLFYVIILEGAGSNLISVAHIYIALICSVRLVFYCMQGNFLRIILGITYSILLVIMYLMSATVGNTERRVEKSEMSPNSVYLAEVIEVINSDRQMRVEIRQNRNINLFIGELKKHPRKIIGIRWGKNITLRWETDEILYVNEKRYVIRE